MTHKRILAATLAAALLATSLPAMADRHGRGHGHHRGYYPAPRVEHHHHHDRHRHGGALALGIAGLALGSIIYSTVTPSPPPVVVAPVVAPPPPRPQRLWYYCDSYRAYYPTVNYCPEGWVTVPGY